MFEPIKNQVDFAKEEESLIRFWQKEAIFQKQVENRQNAENYVFYDGPPFATGLPHYGHLLASTVKDIVPRYFAMRGYRVDRRFGWDCHGLPVEMEIQKQLGLNTQKDIVDYGVNKFNDECKKIVLRYTKEWESTIDRLGRWVDFNNQYKTMDLSFMESVWWVFKTLYQKGLIYRGFKVMPYSWKAGTILSNFEANLNYKSTSDPSIIVKFKLVDKDEYLLAWTTTPWTLISNLGLAVSPNLKYARVRKLENNEVYYLSESAVSKLSKNSEDFEILETISGSELIGLKYEPIFPYAWSKLSEQERENSFKTIDGSEIVNDEEGVGIVHIAPVYGEEDYQIGQRVGLPIYDAVDESGAFLPEIDFVAGQNIKEADPLIIRNLKDRHILVKQENITHSYPFCWRTDTPLMYKAISTWFVKVEDFKENLCENNQKVNWLPTHIKEGRMGKWLENARDWAISRNRFWGTPIPIWECDGDFICVGDVAELEGLTKEKVDDLHKQYVDKLIIKKDGKQYRRVTEVLDCWFESGSMPFGQNHYPFKNKEEFEKNFPAQFISEGLDQTRGWFYTLLVISSGLFGKPSFQNCIVSGLILAEDGKKMSKRLKNYPDPKYVLDSYGADALRVYLISSSVIKGETLRFSENGLKEIMKSIMIPLWNSFTFLVNYAHLDGWNHTDHPTYSVSQLNSSLDRWIFSYLETLVRQVNKAMESYQLYLAVPPIIQFVDKLTNTYIRRSRKRFWRSETDLDKSQAYFTLYEVLKKFSVVLAPFMPFLSDRIYQTLAKNDEPVSVHLENYPEYDNSQVDFELEEEMETIDQILSMGRSLRLKNNLKIRQPLNKLMVISSDRKIEDILKRNKFMIEEELNVKSSYYSSNEEEFVTYNAKVDFKKLGKTFGSKIKDLNQVVMNLSNHEIAVGIQEGELKINLQSEMVKLSPEDLDIRREEKPGMVLSNSGHLTIVLDTELNDELILEGIMRELINRVQKQRKELDLNYNDRIHIHYQGSAKVKKVVEQFQEIISRETLADQVRSDLKQENYLEDSLNGEDFKFTIKKT